MPTFHIQLVLEARGDAHSRKRRVTSLMAFVGSEAISPYSVAESAA
jgi:hypothetical protein